MDDPLHKPGEHSVQQPEEVRLMNPGEVLRIDTDFGLADFEQVVSWELDPEMDEMAEHAWELRTPLIEAIRPPGFNGTISNVYITYIEDSYQTLIEGTQSGAVRLAGQGAPPKNEHLADKCHGFELVADAKASGIRGQIRVKVWYYPLMRGVKIKPNGEGRTLSRRMTKPEFTYEPVTPPEGVARELGALGIGRRKRGMPSETLERHFRTRD